MRPAQLRESLFGPASLERLGGVADLDGHVVTDLDDPASRAALADAELLITGWGSPRIDASVLEAAPGLRVVIHSAGTVKGLVDPVVWERGVRVSSAAAANAQPVAEYTVAMITLAGKRVLQAAAELRHQQGSNGWQLRQDVGNYGRTVGIVGASRTGRRVMDMLAPYDVDIAVYDPFLSDAEAARWGARVTSLVELAARCDIVSLHAPALASTRHMFGATELAAMRDGATLINTARGSLVDHDALLAQLDRRPLYAILDVTEPEPLAAGHPLYDHPRAFLTPHIAGSLGNELQRLGDSVLNEAERYAGGLPLRHEVRLADLPTMA
ncbi:hydroxyacid dehydrogenase [Georgenia halophila]|uniref:Hydroxyacid dehydrogenase n=1 Tax=Georgenia halophila TaxID=620889 RepID=A0ABP8LK90_9MICO